MWLLRGHRDRLVRDSHFLPGNLDYRTEPSGANFIAGAALGTLALVNNVYHSLAARYSLRGALSETDATTLTLVRGDIEGN